MTARSGGPAGGLATGPRADPGMPDEVVIGIDVGTTAAKVVAFAPDGGWAHVEERAYPLREPQPGWQEQDPQLLLRATTGALAACVAALRGTPVTGIGVSAAMHGLIGLGADGHPLTPVVTWADTRATDEVEELRRSGEDREIHRVTGTPVHPMNPLVKIMWFARHEPELTGRVATWVSLKTLVIRCLTGQLVCDLSSASDSGLLDRTTGTWHPTALAWAGLDGGELPPIVPTTHVLELTAALAAEVGLPTGTPVVVGAGDGPMGNLGTGALTPGTVGVSIGTSAAARAVVRGPVVELPPGLFCYALADDLWVVGGASSNGGSASRWTIDLLHPGSGGSVTETEALVLAESVPVGSSGLCVVPYLRPERAPLWDTDITAAVLGLRAHHTGAHLVRATVEGVAVQVAAVVDHIRALGEVTEVRATGGAFRAPLWGRVLAGLLEVPVTVTGVADGSARGAAALASYALGLAGSLDAAAAALAPAADVAACYQPSIDDVTAYRVWRAGVVETYQRLAPAVALASLRDSHPTLRH